MPKDGKLVFIGNAVAVSVKETTTVCFISTVTFRDGITQKVMEIA